MTIKISIIFFFKMKTKRTTALPKDKAELFNNFFKDKFSDASDYDMTCNVHRQRLH